MLLSLCLLSASSIVGSKPLTGPAFAAHLLLHVQEKLGLPEAEQGPVIRKMVEKYIEGVCWVMKYYYEGVRVPACTHGHGTAVVCLTCYFAV